jgi:hypothetical protein
MDVRMSGTAVAMKATLKPQIRTPHPREAGLPRFARFNLSRKAAPPMIAWPQLHLCFSALSLRATRVPSHYRVLSRYSLKR